MGTYIGRIDVKNEVYYNFTPQYEVIDGTVHLLSDEEVVSIIPESEKRNINFSYNPYSQDDEDFMVSYFFEDVPIVFEFEPDELEDNYDRQGYRNPTGYKIRTIDAYNSGKIKSLSVIGFSLLINERDLSEDPKRVNVLTVGTDRLSDDSTIVIDLQSDGIYLGPFDLSYRTIDQTFVASIKPEEHQYLLSGYSYEECERISITTQLGEVTYIRPNENAKQRFIDVITDEQLLNAFKNSVNDDFLLDGKLDLSDIDAAIKVFSESAFMVEDTIIRRNRLQRITEILEISDDVDDTYKYISETLGSELGGFILKYDDKESEESFVNTLVSNNPEILNSLPEYAYVKNQIDELQFNEAELKERISVLSNQLEDIESFGDEGKVTLRNLEAVENELNSIKTEKDTILEEVRQLEEKYSCFKTYAELEESVADLKRDNDYLEIRREQLTRETGELVTRLSDVTTNIEKKLSETPIDGLVANLLTEAASSWKRDMELQEYSNIVTGILHLEVIPKEPAELLEYMYQRVHEVRPLYDKNTVTNICTSIFQSFLTVFSGDPGCGKTSICNIIGQALGLEKVSKLVEPRATRYIPVSVERGWTSKRDFIGYYNPLTKSFDKNNRRVFEALQIADIEEKQGIAKLPMIMLLDEANLSPMEYYWADFMNVCDGVQTANEINVGENQIFSIPETLRVVATINNDHTTETLSPRLIDRATVITLPKVSLRNTSISFNSSVLDDSNIELVSWQSIKETYIGDENDSYSLPASARKVYEEVLKPHLRTYRVYLSPRTDRAIIKYCSVASRLFERESDSARRDPALIALDYATAQKVLPKISGYGEEYSKWLKELMKKCEDNYLIRSKEIIRDIITKGEVNMDYYQFFA